MIESESLYNRLRAQIEKEEKRLGPDEIVRVQCAGPTGPVSVTNIGYHGQNLMVFSGTDTSGTCRCKDSDLSRHIGRNCILLRRASALAFCAILTVVAPAFSARESPRARQVSPADQRQIRRALLEELRPVTLKNCTLKRFGSANDGGYLMCENLIAGLQSAYSYGIETEDNWGCEVSRTFAVPVHQYDCFTPHRPTCEGGRPVFHDECIGPKQERVESRPFDTLTSQISKNGDKEKRLIVKMDVEGAEWDSLLATPDAVLDRIDQMPMELHGVNEDRFLELVRKLKRTFYLVSLHFNNQACSADADPLPAWAYQVLFVNRRLGVPDLSLPARVPGSAPDAPDHPSLPDCQRSGMEQGRDDRKH